MDRKLCDKWKSSSKDRSPITNRKIKLGGRTYNSIEKQCRNFMLGNQILIKQHAIGDGSCFFHSLARLYLDDYEGKRAEGIALRRLIAESLTIKKYIEIGAGLLSKLEMIDRSGIITSEKEFNSLNALQIARNRHDPKLYEILKYNFEKFKRDFLATSVYANEYMLEYTARYLRINIIVVGSNGTITSPRKLVKRYPTIFMYNYFQTHYEPLIGIHGEKMFNWRRTQNMIGDVAFLRN